MGAKLRQLLLFQVSVLVFGLLSAGVGDGLAIMAEDQPSCTVAVDPGSSIQSTIDGTSPGAVICLSGGTWNENVEITKNLTIQGAGRDQTRITGKEAGKPVIHVESASEIQVAIEGFTIAEAKDFSSERWCAADYPQSICPDGIQIRGRAKAVVQDVQISANVHDGLLVWDFASATISSAVISGNGRYGLLMMGSASATISNTQISGNGGEGIRMFNSVSATISDSRISGNDDQGVQMRDSARMTLQNTQISGNGEYGIYTQDSTNVTISTTEISGNGAYGIFIWESASFKITDSTISSNKQHGIVLRGAGQTEIRGNKIPDNLGWGIAAWLKKCGFDGDFFTGTITPSTEQEMMKANDIHDNQWQACLP